MNFKSLSFNAILSKTYKSISTFSISSKEMFILRKKVRLVIMLFFLFLILTFNLVYKNWAIHKESGEMRKYISKIVFNEKSIDLTKNPTSNNFYYNSNESVINVRRDSSIHLFLVRTKLDKGNMKVAVEEEGKILHWQWDWRLLSSDHIGMNYFIFHIPNNMYKQNYNVHLIYDKAGAVIEGIHVLPLKRGCKWKDLLYNDVFYEKNQRIKPKLSSGLNISPRKADIEIEDVK